MNEYLLSAGLSEQAIDALVKAGAATILGLCVAIIMTPLQIRKLRKDLESRSVRLFKKIRRIEDYHIDKEIRDFGEIQTKALVEMRKDQRDASDERDAATE